MCSSDLTCEGETISLDATGFQRITNEALDIAMFMIKNMAMAGSSYMTPNLMRAANAFRCAV